MGIEYVIRFPVNRAETDRDLRSLASFSDFDADYGLYNFRFDPSAVSQQPNAWARVEDDGLYFCDNGGLASERAVIFRSVIDLVLRSADKIEIEQL